MQSQLCLWIVLSSQYEAATNNHETFAGFWVHGILPQVLFKWKTCSRNTKCSLHHWIYLVILPYLFNTYTTFLSYIVRHTKFVSNWRSDTRLMKFHHAFATYYASVSNTLFTGSELQLPAITLAKGSLANLWKVDSKDGGWDNLREAGCRKKASPNGSSKAINRTQRNSSNKLNLQIIFQWKHNDYSKRLFGLNFIVMTLNTKGTTKVTFVCPFKRRTRSETATIRSFSSPCSRLLRLAYRYPPFSLEA